MSQVFRNAVKNFRNMLSYKNFATKFLHDKLLTTLFYILGGGQAPQNGTKSVVNNLSYKNFLAKFLYDNIFQKFWSQAMAFTWSSSLAM